MYCPFRVSTFMTSSVETKSGTLTTSPRLHGRRLRGPLRGVASVAGVCQGHAHVHSNGHLHGYGRFIVQDQVSLELVHQVGNRVLQLLFGQRELLERLLVHEVIEAVVVVDELRPPSTDVRLRELDVEPAERAVDHTSRLDLTEPDAHRGRALLHLGTLVVNDNVRLAVEVDRHAFAQFSVA